MKKFLLLLTATMMLASCSNDFGETVHNLHYENEIINSVDNDGYWDVTLHKSNGIDKVELEVPEKLLGKVNCKLEKDGTLELSVRWSDWNSYSEPIFRAHIYITDLKEIKASGAAQLQTAGVFIGDKVEIDLRGASSLRNVSMMYDDSEIELRGASLIENVYLASKNCIVDMSGASVLYAELQSDSVEFEISGASFVEMISGEQIDLVSLEMDGASSFDGVEAEVRNMLVDIEGASQGKVFVTNKIEGNLAGASMLQYKGKPNCYVECTGGSVCVPMP